MEKKKTLVGVFLVHSLEPGIGGMETHQQAFIDYYFKRQKSDVVSFNYIVENSSNIITLHDYSEEAHKILEFKKISELISYFNRSIVFDVLFLNDGWWIESVMAFRLHYPCCIMIMRSGGNDVELAPWNVGTHSYTERRKLWKDSINNLDCIVANSNYSISRLLNLGINKDIVYKIRGGVDEYVCKEYRKHKCELKHQIRIENSIKQKFIIVFACRFVEFKGIIPALQSLKCSLLMEKSHILFVGSGKLEYQIKEWCISNIKSNQYTFLGELTNSETIRTIAGSDLLVNSSLNYCKSSGDGSYIHTETMGRSMMEALSVRTLILATDVGGTQELFLENKNIGVVCSACESSMVSAFNSIMLTDSKRIEQLQDYSWNHIFLMYDKIINGKSHDNHFCI